MTDILEAPTSPDAAPCNPAPRRPRDRDALIPIRLGVGGGDVKVTVSGAFEMIWDIASVVAIQDDRFDALLRTIERMAYRFAREDLADRRTQETAS